MKINLKQVIPKITRKGYKVEFKENKNNLSLRYKAGSRTVELVTQKELNLDYKFFEGLGLAIGDGLNYPSINNPHFNFANTNFKVIKKMDIWIKKFKVKRIFYALNIPLKCKDQKTIKSALTELNLTRSQIKVYRLERTKRPSIMIQVSGMFQHIYLNLFSYFKEYILNNKEARRAFISGLFAAEGHVKHSVYGTPETIMFTFNAKKEKELALFVKKCLKKEEINSKIKIGRRCSLTVYFTDYNNMLRFYLMGGLDSSEQKKEKFLSLLNNAKIDVHIKGDSLNILKTKQIKMAHFLSCSQANVSKIRTRKSITLSHLKMLSLYSKILKSPEKYVKYLTVSNCYIQNPKLIAFLLKFKT